MAQQEILWLITFTSGDTQEEFGANEADVRDFIQRCFAFKGAIANIAPLHGEDGSEV
jgi:hypothetical protein